MCTPAPFTRCGGMRKTGARLLTIGLINLVVALVLIGLAA
jgi:hypothetical protein